MRADLRPRQWILDHARRIDAVLRVAWRRLEGSDEIRALHAAWVSVLRMRVPTYEVGRWIRAPSAIKTSASVHRSRVDSTHNLNRTLRTRCHLWRAGPFSMSSPVRALWSHPR